MVMMAALLIPPPHARADGGNSVPPVLPLPPRASLCVERTVRDGGHPSRRFVRPPPMPRPTLPRPLLPPVALEPPMAWLFTNVLPPMASVAESF